jgi:ribosomal protein S18 acetylase RimI-like enzyme
MAEAFPNAEKVARALGANAEAMAVGLPGGWASGPPQARAVVTGLPVPTMNGVCAFDETALPAMIERSLDEVRAAGVPFALLARPGGHASASRIAQAWALTTTDELIPLMATAQPVCAPQVEGLHIRRLDDSELGMHGKIAEQAFGVAANVFDTVSEAALVVPGTKLHLGEVDGQPVTTSLSMTTGGATGVFNVATAPEHRGRGYGTAITAHAVSAGFDGGARFVWLQSSRAGHAIYERLGFRTLEHWSCWLSN